MCDRGINFKNKYWEEIMEFCEEDNSDAYKHYPEHNELYLRQCLYNLQEKRDRGIITELEWDKIIYELSFDEYQNGKLI